MMSGIASRFQVPPICPTIFFAVFHAVALASAGSRLEPERKNKRVNEMKMKVRNIDQPLSNQGIGLNLKQLRWIQSTNVPKKKVPDHTTPIIKIGRA